LKRRQGYGGLDLIGRGESERHVLAHLAGEVQLFKKSHKHGHPAQRRYGARSLAQDHAPMGEQRLDLTRDWIVPGLCFHPPVVSGLARNRKRNFGIQA
jgi:hypothetical protein